MPVYLTSCPRNCYSTCSMEVEVDQGKIRRILPHAGNEATPEGVCLKGLSYIERQHSADRILYPLQRTSTGSFERISWDDALTTLAERLLTCKRDYGPQSVLYYTGSGTKGLLNGVGMNFWRLFGGCTTTYGDLCWPAGLEATRLTLGENKHSVPWDLAKARLILAWGKNPAETNVHQMVFMEQAIRAGAKLVVIDPRRTESAEKADLVLQPRPGSDGALALALCRLLIESGSVDQEFVDRNVRGYLRFKEMVLTVELRQAADVCGVPIEQIRQLADWLGGIQPVTINCGFGMQRYTNSGQTLRAILALLCITGNIGKPGAGWVFANLQSQIFGGLKDPLAFYPPEKPDGKVRVSISTARLGQGILKTADPPIKMIWVERGNPVTQNPETGTVLKAFRSVEFRVVVDQFMTDTAREADLILPSKTLFEQTDVINAYWHDYIQIKQKVLEPAGEVKPESVIYLELAERLGLSPEGVREMIPGPTDADIESYLSARLAELPELSLERLKEGPIRAPGSQEVAFSDLKFPTPSGQIELYSTEASDRWSVDPLPVYEEPAESLQQKSLSSEFPLYLLTPNTKNRIHSQFNNLQMIRQLSPEPEMAMNPVDSEARNIRPGDQVRVYNQRGELRLKAVADHSIRPGCVSITNGWWISEGGGVNLLSKGRETDMGYGAAFHDNLVEVERVE